MDTNSPFLRQRRGTRGGVHVDIPRAKDTKKPWSASTLTLFLLRHKDDSLKLALVFFVALLASLVVQYRAELIAQSSALQNERKLRRETEMAMNRSAGEASNYKKSLDRCTSDLQQLVLSSQRQQDELKADILRHKGKVVQLKWNARKMGLDFQERRLAIQQQLAAAETQRRDSEMSVLDFRERLLKSKIIIEDLLRDIEQINGTTCWNLLLGAVNAAKNFIPSLRSFSVRLLT